MTRTEAYSQKPPVSRLPLPSRVEPVLSRILHLESGRRARAVGGLHAALRAEPVNLLDDRARLRGGHVQLQPGDVAGRVRRRAGRVALLEFRGAEAVDGKGGRGGVDEEVVADGVERDLARREVEEAGGDVLQYDAGHFRGNAASVEEGGVGAEGDGDGCRGRVGAGVVLRAAADGDEGESQAGGRGG